MLSHTYFEKESQGGQQRHRAGDAKMGSGRGIPKWDPPLGGRPKGTRKTTHREPRRKPEIM
eukprot:2881507-Karenia_brevis.AAC.1